MKVSRQAISVSFPQLARGLATVALSCLLSSQAVSNSASAASPRTVVAMMDDKEMGSMGGQGQANSSMPGMGGMSGSQSGGMGGGMMGCCMGSMGQAPGSGSPAGSGMSMRTDLPGFPGASHLYHVGATGFYLDYADKLGLSTEQRTSLNDIKQRSLVEQSNQQRKIDEAEQALWLLTGAEQPDATAVEAKIREIEKLNADQRMAFIRSVGEAGKSLTTDQRKMVLGMAPMPGPSSSAASPAKQMMNMGR